ncbi:hypothetical protein B9Z19DRAFT_1097256 [Tuber borchii]|uniref:Uncharacterized protein n=1 Tax=Tuber borchii TaxID=42251 RepID=A0A2T6ZAJ2_TUBBO|nr:hypothetical protein B9Z19DRAFT_1097256 [Tuber borchii]
MKWTRWPLAGSSAVAVVTVGKLLAEGVLDEDEMCTGSVDLMSTSLAMGFFSTTVLTEGAVAAMRRSEARGCG